jgi:ribosomal protein S18 acetylase RimI-like enzyme
MDIDDITIRPARQEDVPAIVALLADDPLGATREDIRDLAAYRRAFDEVAAQDGNIILVAARGATAEDILGCLQLTLIAGLSRHGMKRGQIEGVRVSAACRGRGIGERLVRHAVDTARAAGCGLVQLTSDLARPDAHRFYERLGFVASHVGMKLALG